MNRKEGEKVLTEIFQNCPWKEKYKDMVPENEDSIIYQWTAEQAEYALPFFSKTGQAILTEETCVAKRSLYLGMNSNNSLCLYVQEREKDEYRKGIPDMARDFACMMKVDNLIKEKK
ncbi:hypothetical protein [Desulfonatronovibrio hydrogenovorans]|uniref:hypothetical protein n=1 Tax=Desulfonatronovibrio hydrogenovorans TaxID=53245 RepID=UPI00048DCF2E|nr:hypothetical protein [Desulfonatronovibrio hydrogenovorans]